MSKNYGGRGIVLDVTQEIINAATERSSSHCIIADALRAAVPDATRVSVDLQTIRYTLNGRRRRYIYLTPALAQAVLVQFDQGLKPKPFLFRLGKPAQIMRSDARAHEARGERKPRGVKVNDGDSIPIGQARNLKKTTKSAPVVIGGTYPPTAALSSTRGRRRTFGLKSLKP